MEAPRLVAEFLMSIGHGYDPLDLVLSKLEKVRKSGSGYIARCPKHGDHRPSLSVTTGDKGQVLFHCFNGCTAQAVAAALGMTMSELYPDHGQPKERRDEPKEPRRIVAEYDYVDADGEVIYQNVRFEPKHFSARRPDEKGGWVWKLDGVPRVPFNLPGLLTRATGDPVFLTEGEKDALRLVELGLTASCHKSLGGEAWRPEWNRYLTGSSVYIVRDNDKAGIEYADRSARVIHAAVIEVTIIALPGLPLHGDISDWLAAGNAVDDLLELAGTEELWRPEADAPPVTAMAQHPDFPIDTLPPAMRALCEEASAAFGYPAAYVALPALAVVGTMAGGAIELHLKPGWFERAVGWFVQIGDPGSAKSPAQDLALAPVQAIQRDLYDYYKTVSDNYFEQPKNERKGDSPELEVLMTTDTTIEGVTRHHRFSLLIAPDELTAWLAGFNRYRGAGASERGQWLSGWALSQIMTTRASKGAVIIPRPTINVTGGIQPDRLRMLLQDAKGDSMNDGFLDRLLPCWPASDPPEWTETEIDQRTLDNWSGLVGEIRGVRRYAPEDQALKVRIGDDAKVLWRQWYNANNRSTKAAQGMGRGWSAKAPRHLLRLTLALHIATDPETVSQPIDRPTLEAGIELVDWFRDQHGMMLSALGAGESSKGAGITTRIERLLNTSHNEWVSRTVIYRTLRNVPSDALQDALDQLETDGRIERRRIDTGTKPREEIRVRTFSFSHYSQNLPTDKRMSWDCPCGANNSIVVYSVTCPSCGAKRMEAA